MACISSTKRTRILAQIAKKEAQLEKLEDTFDGVTNELGIKEYRFDSAEGSQKGIRWDPDKILKTINDLESQINSLYTRLNRSGVVNMNLRRKVCNNNYPGGYR